VFYGAMVAEGIIALIWASAACTLLGGAAIKELGGGGAGTVFEISTMTMKGVGMVLAVLGVIACPITSGDTAFRSARLTLADWFKLDMGNWKTRLFLCIPVLGIGAILGFGNTLGFIDYQVIWRYFSWANQVLAMFTLWAVTVFLSKLHPTKGWYWITLVPALFMSMVTISFLFVAYKEGLGSVLPHPVGYAIAAVLTAALGVLFFLRRNRK
jgi:carbon starvation protein CstA